MTRPWRVAVIGGGVAGTTAALAAADAGAQVTLVERRPQLGGLAESFTRDGLAFDNGQHVFLRCCIAYRRLLRRLEAEQLTELQPRLAIDVLLARDGQLRRTRLTRSRLPLPSPLHTAGGLLRYAGVPARRRLAAGRAALELARLAPADPRVDAQRLGDWLAARGATADEIAGLWELLIVATLNTPVAEASLALAAKVVRTGLLQTPAGGDIGRARAPLGRIHHDAALAALTVAGVDVQLRTAVRGLVAQDGGWLIAYDTGGVAVDAVVLAVPPDVAADLAPAGALPDPQRLRTMPHSPIVNLHLVYDRPVLDVPFLAVVGSPVQWIFDRTASSGLAERQPGAQCLAVSLSAADDVIDEPTSVLRERFSAELARLFPATRSARLQTFVVSRERAATPRQAAGFNSSRPGPTTTLPHLALAGAWTDTGWPATLEGAARSGEAAVTALLAARDQETGAARRVPAGAAS